MNAIGIAGRKGETVRSDCWVSIELTDSGGIQLDLKSRVAFLYADSIRQLVQDELTALGVTNARVQLEDSGAVPFVIMARVEAAVRRARPDAQLPEFLPEPGPSFARPTTRDRWRRSRLYLPGNEPKFMLNARIHQPDGVILDIEDSVPPEEKDAALILVRNALIAVDFGECERMVRINQLPRGLDELAPLVKAGVNVILIPKCEDDSQVTAVAERISAIQQEFNLKHDVFLMPIVETCQGMFQAHRIAAAAKRVVALTYGMEDYIADLAATKTPAGLESLWARSQIVNAARAAGVQPIDTVFADVSDLAGLEASCLAAKELGFEGKGCIHPRQIRVVNNAFTPSASEIERACQIYAAFRIAEQQGKSVAVIGSKMIDPPVVRRARRTIELAIAAGKLSPDWHATFPPDKEV